MKINEIFYSLQGEGCFTGTPAVFLRFSGCNMQCPFCDTRHEEGTEMSEEDIVKAIGRYPARHIVITGGEPTMQLNARLTGLLKETGCFIQIETNGSLPLKDGVRVDWTTCSPKGNTVRIQHIDELKLLFIPEYIRKYEGIRAERYCLQPLDSGDAEKNERNLRATIEHVLANPKWRLSLQTHKIIGIT